MELTTHLIIWVFAAIVALFVALVDMFGRVDYIKSRAPFLDKVLKRREALPFLLLVAIFLLAGYGDELWTKEIPEVPNLPALKLVPPVPPAITVVELAPPIKAQCWVKNYAAPAAPAPPWGMATVFCNTTIKPPYSVELDYDRAVLVGPFTFPVGSEFMKAFETNQGTKVVSMFDLHTIIPNEPFSIMAQGSQGSNDNAPLVKTATIRAKGLVFEFHP